MRVIGRVGDRGAGAMDQSADRAAAQQDLAHFLGAGFLGSNPYADTRQYEARGGGLLPRRRGVYSAGYFYGPVAANLQSLRSHRRDAAAGAAARADSVGDAVFRSRRQDENLCNLFFLRLADPAQYARRSAQHRPGAGEHRPDVRLVAPENPMANRSSRLLAAGDDRHACELADHADPRRDFRNGRQHGRHWLLYSRRATKVQSRADVRRHVVFGIAWLPAESAFRPSVSLAARSEEHTSELQSPCNL